MALIAAFIGIDKHADPRIRDLMGARRDAVALWSLFCDTLPGLCDQAYRCRSDCCGDSPSLDEIFYAPALTTRLFSHSRATAS